MHMAQVAKASTVQATCVIINFLSLMLQVTVIQVSLGVWWFYWFVLKTGFYFQGSVSIAHFSWHLETTVALHRLSTICSVVAQTLQYLPQLPNTKKYRYKIVSSKCWLWSKATGYICPECSGGYFTCFITPPF